MKYISTLDIWSPQIQEAIERGQIKLQRGQWLRCGSAGKRCRFVEVSKAGNIHVTHWKQTARETNRRFMYQVTMRRHPELYKAYRQERSDGKTTATWQEYQAISH